MQNEEHVWLGALPPAAIFLASIVSCQGTAQFLPSTLFPPFASQPSFPPSHICSCTFHTFPFPFSLPLILFCLASSNPLLPLIHHPSALPPFYCFPCAFPAHYFLCSLFLSYPFPTGSFCIPVYSTGCAMGDGSAGLWPILELPVLLIIPAARCTRYEIH